LRGVKPPVEYVGFAALTTKKLDGMGYFQSSKEVLGVWLPSVLAHTMPKGIANPTMPLGGLTEIP
jgi:hypothetical protein